MTTKTALVILSDPDSGSDEAFGRAFNGLAAAHEHDQAGDDVLIIFQGAGIRWPEVLQRPDHPANGLYQAVQHIVAGVSAGCASAFGAADGASSADLPLLGDNPVPGTPGVASIRRLQHDGYTVHIF
jgi:hypothetical protein